MWNMQVTVSKSFHVFMHKKYLKTLRPFYNVNLVISTNEESEGEKISSIVRNAVREK